MVFRLMNLLCKKIELNSYQPLIGSFAVIKCKGKTLLCYNNWRNQWEIPVGQRGGMKPRGYVQLGDIMKKLDK
jgi:hypothetical protein